MSADPVPRNQPQPYGHKVPANTELTCHNPDLIGEISFVEHLTDQLLLIVQDTVRLNSAQSAHLEKLFKKYLNKAL